MVKDAKIGDGARIGAFSHVEAAAMAPGAGIGPFARLRAGAAVDAGAYVGNFCEVKNARVGPRTNVCHLSYLGDAELGENVNIGAGTITCNFSARAHPSLIHTGLFWTLSPLPRPLPMNACMHACTVMSTAVNCLCPCPCMHAELQCPLQVTSRVAWSISEVAANHAMQMALPRTGRQWDPTPSLALAPRWSRP